MRAFQQVFRRLIKIEKPQLFYWLPALLGAGMALYYALPYEPSSRLYFLPPISFVALLLLRKFKVETLFLHFIYFLIAIAAWVSLGASYAKWRTADLDIPMLTQPLTIRPVEGTVDTIEHLEHGLRITLSDIQVSNLPPDKTPKRARVSLRAKTVPDIEIGQRISLRAALLPPSGPVMDNAFDFGRYFYFRHIGAVGYAIMPITIKSSSKATGFLAFWRSARDHLTGQIHAVLPGVEGAVAAGLITGDDSAIPPKIYDELRAANLIHIIAISGSHMVVIAGIIFVCLRAILVFIPRYGLRPEIKPLVALLTWISISCYLCITGFELSAVRAYVMLSFLLFAIILRREVVAMRSIALSALFMLIIDPSDIIEPGFQLSFAATFALIAAFDTLVMRHHALDSRFTRTLRLVSFMLLTTVIAEAATLPLILFHFNNFTLYGVVSNLVLTPVVTMIIMPMVALYFVLLPLGIEAFALHIMALGINAMLWVAHTVSGWPYALQYVPSPTPLGISISVFGLLWLCIWRTRMRLIGVPVICAGLLTSMQFRAPDIFISSGAQQVAYRSEKGYVMLHGRPNGLFAKLWANGVGQSAFLTLKQAQPVENIECTRGGCRLIHDNISLHFSYTVPDIKQGCPKTDYWISGYYLYPEERKACAASTKFIDRTDFNAKGSAWGWFEKEGLALYFTRDEQGYRPWSIGWNTKK